MTLTYQLKPPRHKGEKSHCSKSKTDHAAILKSEKLAICNIKPEQISLSEILGEI